MGRLLQLSAFRIALLVAAALLIAYLPLSHAPLMRELEGRLLDLRFTLRAVAPPSEDVVVLLIDDEAIHTIGRWPWSRGVLARLVERIDAAGAAVIGTDLLFADPEQAVVPAQAIEALREALDLLGDEGGLADVDDIDQVLQRFLRTTPGDDDLALSLREAGNVVVTLAAEVGPEIEGAPPSPPPPYVASAAYRITRGSGAARRELLPARALLPPIPVIGEAAAALGHATIPLEPGERARFEYPAIAYLDGDYPSFAIEVVRLYLGLARERVRLDLGRGVQFGEILVPTDERTRLPVNHRGPGRFRTASVAAVLDGRVPQGWLAGKIVLIGAAAPGVGTTLASPFAREVPAVMRHATVIDGILRQDFLLRRDRDAALVDIAVVIAGALVLGLVGTRRGPMLTTVTAATLILALVTANVALFAEADRWLNLALPLLALGLIYAAVVAYQYLVGLRRERLLRNAFRHYVNPELVDRVASDPSLLRLGGEERELTVLFADIRNSTRLAGQLGSAEFVTLLNDVFAALSRVVFTHHGMLDKFLGDGMLVVFGAPLPRPDHAESACRAALEMLDAVAPVRARWARPGLPRLEIGIGINTGPMIIGNMGSSERFDYTVIGDEASLGARLEAANRDLRTRILINEATWRAVEGTLAAREIDVVRFRGVERPVRLFELRGPLPLPAAEARLIEWFHAGIAAWRRGDLQTATGLFEQVLTMAPDDYPAQLYLQRCRRPSGAAAIAGAPPQS